MSRWLTREMNERRFFLLPEADARVQFENWVRTDEFRYECRDEIERITQISFYDYEMAYRSDPRGSQYAGLVKVMAARLELVKNLRTIKVALTDIFPSMPAICKLGENRMRRARKRVKRDVEREAARMLQLQMDQAAAAVPLALNDGVNQGPAGDAADSDSDESAASSAVDHNVVLLNDDQKRILSQVMAMNEAALDRDEISIVLSVMDDQDD